MRENGEGVDEVEGSRCTGAEARGRSRQSGRSRGLPGTRRPRGESHVAAVDLGVELLPPARNTPAAAAEIEQRAEALDGRPCRVLPPGPSPLRSRPLRRNQSSSGVPATRTISRRGGRGSPPAAGGRAFTNDLSARVGAIGRPAEGRSRSRTGDRTRVFTPGNVSHARAARKSYEARASANPSCATTGCSSSAAVRRRPRGRTQCARTGARARRPRPPASVGLDETRSEVDGVIRHRRRR